MFSSFCKWMSQRRFVQILYTGTHSFIDFVIKRLDFIKFAIITYQDSSLLKIMIGGKGGLYDMQKTVKMTVVFVVFLNG